MNTVRVDICYRPLRIAWAIHSSDKEAFRNAVRLSHTMWGGTFNPIVLVDRSTAQQIVEVFRADIIMPLGESAEVKRFADLFPHLINPFFSHEFFIEGGKGMSHAQVIDVQNAFLHWKNHPEWTELKEQGIRFLRWEDGDPLADAFLMQYGAYPEKEKTGIDYTDLLNRATMATSIDVHADAPIPSEVIKHPGIRFLSRIGLYRHYSVAGGWNQPGFFIGDATNLDDLVCCWNLKAADIAVHFIDHNHPRRYEVIQPAIEEQLRVNSAQTEEHRRGVALWSRAERLEDFVKLFSDPRVVLYPVSEHSWNGRNIRAPMMAFGEESSLGVINQEEGGRPKVSFSLKDKPFSSDTWFHTQHLVASVSLSGTASNEHYTFLPPYVPELNEFLASAMHFEYSKLRVEPERIGLVIDAVDHDSFLYALPVASLIEQLFAMAGLTSKPSGAGLIARQLIARLGGVEGARVFKIPGVRKLLKTYSSTDTFTKSAALQLIGCRDPDNPQATFKDHKRLFIEPRTERELTPQMVFKYLVGRGLFRIGYELHCPACNLNSWIPLDDLKQSNVCNLCGVAFDATRQLIDGEFRYRRSGVLGMEKNAQGSVPVALVLQQLTNNMHSLMHGNVYATSYDLKSKIETDPPQSEVDFIMVFPCGGDPHVRKADVILGECKDAGGSIDRTDVENLRKTADAFPKHRFNTYIAFARLAPFSPEEIKLARSLNGQYQSRVILLTARELEPYRLYERVNKELGTQFHGISPQDLAQATETLYFSTPSAQNEQVSSEVGAF